MLGSEYDDSRMEAYERVKRSVSRKDKYGYRKIPRVQCDIC